MVGLILAFGLTLQWAGTKRARPPSWTMRTPSERLRVSTPSMVTAPDANLRAKTLPEPIRSNSLQRLKTYTDTEIVLSDAVPGSDESVAAAAAGSALQRQLWSLAGQALDRDPIGSATRLYVDSLNEMIDQQTVHLAAMGNRVPGTVLALEVLGAAAALGLLAVYLAVLGRGVLPVLLGAALVAILLFVTFDLDRPTRGLIQVEPTALVAQRASMELPPAATGPT